MKALTIEELHAVLGEAIKKGQARKKILIPSDDEGNSYHEMFFGISKVEDCVSDGYQLPHGVSMNMAKKGYVILG